MMRGLGHFAVVVTAIAGIAFAASRPAGATIPITPDHGDPNTSVHAEVDVQTPSQLDACLRAVGTPSSVHVSFAPACGNGRFTSTMAVSANPKLAPGFRGSFTVEEYPADDPSQAPFDQANWRIDVPAATTTTTATTSTTLAPTTSGPASVPTTVAPATTILSPTSVAPLRPVPTATSDPGTKSLVNPLVAVPVAALVGVGIALVVRRRRPAPRRTPPATEPGTAPVPAGVTSARRPPPGATVLPPGTAGGSAGLASPLSSIDLPWGRVLPLRAAVTDGSHGRFRWRIDDLQQGQSGRWAAWAPDRLRGGFRHRRAIPAGDETRGEQVLLLHPFLAAVGDIALVKIAVTVDRSAGTDVAGDAHESEEFPVWIRFERTSDWIVAADVVHAATVVEPATVVGGEGDPAPEMGSAEHVSGDLELPDGPWATGERLVLAVDAGVEPGAWRWSASGGSFPAGSTDRVVVYECPTAPGEVRISVRVTDTARNTTVTRTATRTVAVHRVMVVNDVFADALDGGTGRLWPPAGNDPFAELRAAGPHLRVIPGEDDLRAAPPPDAGRRAVEIITAAGHKHEPAPFDWRLAPAAAARGVEAAWERIHPADAASPQVTVVAHGYGGMVVRELLRDPDIAVGIDDAVLAGVPHHGVAVAFRWLRFGGRFGPTHTSRLADVGDAVASAAGRNVVETWPALYHLLPTSEWFAGAGPVLDDRVGGTGWRADPAATYLGAPGALAWPELVADARQAGARGAAATGDVRFHGVYGIGAPTEFRYSYGPAHDLEAALEVAGDEHETRSFHDRDHTLIVAFIDGDGIVPVESARSAWQTTTWATEHRVAGAAHEDLLENIAVLAYVVYLIEHLAPDAPGPLHG